MLKFLFGAALTAALALGPAWADDLAATRARPADAGTVTFESGSGGGDMSVTVQAAVSTLCARPVPGGTVRFAAGRYRFHDIEVPCSGIVFRGVRGGGNATSGTFVDYSDAARQAIRFAPPKWPAVTHQDLLYGVAVEDMTLFTSTAAKKTRALDFQGFNSGRIRDVHIVGEAHNGIRLYGGYKFDIANFTSNYYPNLGPGIANRGIEIVGDMSGRSRSGGACTLGDCSTRVDLVSLHNVDMLGTETGCGLCIRGTVNTTMGDNIDIENKAYGLFVSCPKGFPNLSYCPQFLRFVGFDAEGTVETPVSMRDFTDAQFVDSYAVGNGPSVSHAVDVALENYTQGDGAGGGFRWSGGRMANAGGSVVRIAVSDTKITDAIIKDGNLKNNGGVGVEYAGGDVHHESNNTYCRYVGVTSPPMGGVSVTPDATNVTLVGDTFIGCTSGVTGTLDNVSRTAITGP